VSTKEKPVIRKILPVMVALSFLAWPLALRAQDTEDQPVFSPEQLANLVAPIALYPDPLLAQVLLAATFPDQIDDAARFVRGDPNLDDVDSQWWDVSVKAVAHYPAVLDMMASNLDWTTALGQAYVYQSTDVMTAVQQLRVQARNEGNLVTTPEMQVVDNAGYIELWPAQPNYIYVPEYDPAVVFAYRAPLFFGARLFIGSWLNLDFDWHARRVFYHGWEDGHGWIARSRPYIHVNNVYVNRVYEHLTVNHNVVHRQVNYGALDRYDSVHRHVSFDEVRRGRSTQVYTPPHTLPVVPRQPVRYENKVIDRNINVRDPRIDEFRGHVPKAPQPVEHHEATGFTSGHGTFAPHVASERGHTSRMRVEKAPAPPPPRRDEKQRHDDRIKH
jgi:hypothetical protein